MQSPNYKRRLPPGKPSALLDTRVVYCGDNLTQLQKRPPFLWPERSVAGIIHRAPSRFLISRETEEKRAVEDCHKSTQAYFEYMRLRYVQLAHSVKKTGSFYYHCDWHVSHYTNLERQL